ncbi:MAG: GxxExxY protein [Verrucomicrobia bacterium]|nr:GxxExxY protein [Verrucomicrobiota bacterium]
MDTNEHESKVMYAEEVYQIIGFSMNLLKAVGHGFHEKIYENGLVVDFKQESIEYLQQPEYKIDYRGEILGVFIPDLISHGKIVIDTKTIDRITDHERGKMLNYLRTTEMRLGLIINFKHAKLEWERIVL